MSVALDALDTMIQEEVTILNEVAMQVAGGWARIRGDATTGCRLLALEDARQVVLRAELRAAEENE